MCKSVADHNFLISLTFRASEFIIFGWFYQQESVLQSGGGRGVPDKMDPSVRRFLSAVETRAGLDPLCRFLLEPVITHDCRIVIYPDTRCRFYASPTSQTLVGKMGFSLLAHGCCLQDSLNTSKTIQTCSTSVRNKQIHSGGQRRSNDTDISSGLHRPVGASHGRARLYLLNSYCVVPV